MTTLTPVALSQDRVDTLGLRKALGRFATGVTIVTTRSATGTAVGLTANSFSAVSLDPPLVLWSLRRDARSAASFRAAGRFAVNVLAADQLPLARRFSASIEDRFPDTGTRPGLGGCLLIDGCLAHFECTLQQTIEGGDHLVFIGRVERAAQREGDPLIFANGAYCISGPTALAAAAE